jgi:hypothetical protein
MPRTGGVESRTGAQACATVVWSCWQGGFSTSMVACRSHDAALQLAARAVFDITWDCSAVIRGPPPKLRSLGDSGRHGVRFGCWST